MRGFISLAAIFAASMTATAVRAGETGGGAYPNGAESLGVANLPPPGNYLLDYVNYYGANRLNDRNGESLVRDFSINAYANVFRVVHVTPYKLLGATVAMQTLIPVVDLAVEAGGAKDHAFGIGDIVVNPLILGWSINNLKVVAAVDTFVPAGDYDKTKLANIGRNYWTFEPVLAVTYATASGFDASAKVMYDFNTTNKDTDYASGDEFHVDFGVGYTTSGTSFGLAGYYYKQTTDDQISGVRVGPDGNRGEVFAIGPTVRRQFGALPLHFQWQHEFESRNRPEGDKLWIKTAVRF